MDLPTGRRELVVLLERAARTFLLILVNAYRSIGAVHLGGACRFEPSCSIYACEALHQHSPTRAVGLIGRRLLKCRPGGPWGYDPVPIGERLSRVGLRNKVGK